MREDAEWSIRNLGSKNGMWIDRARLLASSLSPDSEIGIGGLTLPAESEQRGAFAQAPSPPYAPVIQPRCPTHATNPRPDHRRESPPELPPRRSHGRDVRRWRRNVVAGEDYGPPDGTTLRRQLHEPLRSKQRAFLDRKAPQIQYHLPRAFFARAMASGNCP